MIKLVDTTESDVSQIEEWASEDVYHQTVLNGHWWLTGQGLLSFALLDETGPLAFVRLDHPVDGYVRLHTQFGPRDEVNKLRLIKGMLKCVPIVLNFAKSQKIKGIVFESISPSLIVFMEKKFGFVRAEGTDYKLDFEVS